MDVPMLLLLPLQALAAVWVACRNLLAIAPGSAPWTDPVCYLQMGT